MTFERVELYHGDCLDVMAELPEHSVDTIITDPPAGIAFMGKRWDNLSGHEPRTERGRVVWRAFKPLVDAEMLAPWEAGFLLFGVDWATAALRLLKPGGMALVWSLPRTTDLTQFALRLAGWEIRDIVAHVFGSGFPKSHDISKAIDKAAGAEREVVRYEATKASQKKRGFSKLTTTMSDPQGKAGHKDNGATLTKPATDLAREGHGYGPA